MRIKEHQIKLRKTWPKGFTIPDTRPFEEITRNFNDSFSSLLNKKNRFPVSEYFGEGVGLKSTQEKLKNIYQLRKKDKDFQGIYLFFIDEEPIYTGISRVVLKRVQQHVKGSSHFTSSLCYKMGANYYEEINGKKHCGGRKGLCFKTYSEPFKIKLRDSAQVAILPVESAIELYLLECYVAVEAKTHFYNRFETH